MRGDVRQKKVSLKQRFPNETELKLLQVAKPTVDQLARPARSSGSKIVLFDYSDA